MAGETRKGSALPEVTTVQDTDQLYLMRLSETLPQQRNKRVSLPNLLKNAISTVLKFTQAGTGAVERTVDNKLKECVSVADFGAVGNGVTDDTSAIQAAINYVQSMGGGRVYVPQGRYKLTSSLDITKASTVLVGCGGDSPHDAGNNVDGATIFEWYGAADLPVIKIRTVPNLATGSKISGSGIKDIDIKCRNTAGIGVFVCSVNKLILRRINVESPTLAAFKLTTLQTGVDIAEACDAQNSLIEGLSWRCLEGASRNAHGIWLTSHGFPSTANVSLNTFMHCAGQNWGQAGSTGIGYFIEDGDNINWIRCTGFRIYYDVPAVEIRGHVFTDAHHFYNCTFGGANSIRIKGIASGYLSNPVRCSFYAMDNGNGTQPPVLDANCRVSYHSDQGVQERARATQLNVSDGIIDAAQASLGVESLRIFNASNGHIKLVNQAGHEWGINIDATTGNLRFTPGPTAGTSEAAGPFSVSSGRLRLNQSIPPASVTSTGSQGQIAWDANYLYVCIATNTWKRVAITTW